MEKAIPIALPRVRPDLIARPQLQARLTDTLGRNKLLLLIAPAGYGKTVALVQALRGLPADHAVAWVSSGAEEELQHLLAALLEALDPFDLPWRVSPDALPAVALREGGLDAVVDELVHALGQAEVPRGVMAFDDVHRIADPVVLDFMRRLLGALPPKWALAMTSRVDPPLQLARLRLAGEVVEIRQEELRFQHEEVRTLLQAAKLPEGTGQVDQLLQRTHGWVAGLYLELLAQAGPDARQVQRHTFDYLAEEVLGQLPSPMQEFLLRCSVLQDLDARRCEHVSGDSRAALWLDELERRDLFVTVLDDEQFTLRLHNLFREFLERKLSLDHSEEVTLLLIRAAESEPDVMLRVGYLLRAGAADEAVQLLFEMAASMVHSGRGEQLIRLIERLPQPLRSESPEVAFMRGLFAGQRAEWLTMLVSMRHALERFEQRQQWVWAVQARGLACLAMYYVGRTSEGLALWAAATRIETDPASQITDAFLAYWRSLMYGPSESTSVELWRVVRLLSTETDADHWAFHFHVHFVAVGRFGMRAPLATLVKAMLAHADESRPQLRLAAMRLMAWLALWKGDFDEARSLCDEVSTEAQWLGNPPLAVTYNQVLVAFERHLSGDYPQARSILMAISDATRGNPQRRSHHLAAHLLAGLATAAQDWSTAHGLLLVLEDSSSEAPEWPFMKLQSATLRAELALHEGNPTEAIALLQPLVGNALDWDNFAVCHRTCVTLARARLRAGQVEAAWEVLRPAVQQAMDAEEPVGLLLCGPTALQELAEAAWPNIPDSATLAYLRHWSTRCLAMQSSHSTSTMATVQHASALHSDLSDREMQVIELVIQGHGNKAIARALDISPHTVKRHMARIFDKTGQSSRGGVAAWHGAQVVAATGEHKGAARAALLTPLPPAGRN